jgi:hypothetical protein
MFEDSELEDESSAQAPISVELWFLVMTASVVVLAAVAYVIIEWLLPRQPSWFGVTVLVVMTLFVTGLALAANKAIPTNSRNFEDWRRPAVIARLLVTIVVTGLGPPLAFVTFLGREPDAAPLPPKPAPILSLIEGRWGEEPDCALVWDIAIIERAGKRAFKADLVVPPKGVGSWTLLAEITAVDDLTMTVSGLEPATARGSTAIFTLNPATQRLDWEDRSKPGDVEVYRRCPA